MSVPQVSYKYTSIEHPNCIFTRIGIRKLESFPCGWMDGSIFSHSICCINKKIRGSFRCVVASSEDGSNNSLPLESSYVEVAAKIRGRNYHKTNKKCCPKRKVTFLDLLFSSFSFLNSLLAFNYANNERIIVVVTHTPTVSTSYDFSQHGVAWVHVARQGLETVSSFYNYKIERILGIRGWLLEAVYRWSEKCC